MSNQLHQRPRSETSLSDEWETPKSMFEWLTNKFGFYPILDVCANNENKKCEFYLGFDNPLVDYRDGLKSKWLGRNWCNPPHSKTEDFVKKACFEFQNNGNETMMIIPANSTCTSYAESCINGIAESYPIFERPRFKQDGQTKDSARNSYYVIIWRKK